MPPSAIHRRHGAAIPPRVPQHILESLEEASARLGGLPLPELVAAAVWAFDKQEPVFKDLIVRVFWAQGIPAPRRSQKTWIRRIYELVRALFAPLRHRRAR